MRKRFVCLVCLVAFCVALILAAAPPMSAQAVAPPDCGTVTTAPSSGGGLLARVWEFLNSPFGIALVATAGLAILNVIAKRAPKLAQLLATYKGDIIAAIKYAEKSIPDDAQNVSLARLDAALKYAIAVIAEGERRALSPPEIAAIRSSISEVHDELESVGTLKK